MITRNYGILRTARSNGALMQWQLAALAVAWGLIFVRLAFMVVQS